MKPGVIYRMQWDTVDTVRKDPSLNVPSKVLTVNIYDTETLIEDDEDEEVITLQAAMPPLTITTIDNSEDKFTPVIGKQATIRFLTDSAQGQDAGTFADSSDNRWRVEALAADDPIFVGFLMLSDIQQPFLPDPQVVELTASDHLGVLKDVPLTDDDNELLSGKFKIGQIIAYCLKKTGLSLPLRVVNNLRHGSGTFSIEVQFIGGDNDLVVANSNAYLFYAGQEITISGSASNNGTFKVQGVGTGIVTLVGIAGTLVTEGPVTVTFNDTSEGHFYDKIYLDIKTFEKSISESEDCRTVLEKILGEDSKLFQWKGFWTILRLDEVTNNSMYMFPFDADGNLGVDWEEINPIRNIGASANVCHANAGTIFRMDRPHKFVKETFRYESPKEIVCNIDFSRGDVISSPDLSAATGTGTYQIDCWTVRRISGSVTSTAHITRKFIYGVENERYLTITPKTGGVATPWDFAESQPIEVLAGDKADVSVDYKHDSNHGSGGTTIFPMKIYLKGDDGNWYYWWHSTSTNLEDFTWTNAGTSEVERLIPVVYDASAVDESQWRSLSVNLHALPVAGKLYIGLIQGFQNNNGDNQNFNFQGLNIDYHPYINGSYQLFTGHYNKVSRSDNGYITSRDNQVFIGDSPRKEFKGAMFFVDSGGLFNLTARFYDASLTAITGAPTSTKPYGYWQAFAVWNQYRRANRIFPSTLQGIYNDSEPDEWPDIINKFQLTDTNPNTNNRFFLLISFEQNQKTMIWTGTLIEDFKTDEGHLYTDTHEFKFLTS